jgi:hypothetical protein
VSGLERLDVTEERTTWLVHFGRQIAVLVAAAVVGACGSTSSPTPPSSVGTTTQTLNQPTVIDALDYWASTIGITYTFLSADTPPRLLIRPGTDGLGTATARGGIDGVIASTNQAQSGLVVILPSFGSSCAPTSLSCRALFRHEVGHGVGFLGEPATGMMSAFPDTDVLTDREKNMMIALYSLPIGAALSADGSWSVAATGAAGKLSDLQAVQDIITYNMNAPGFSRTPGLVCRWQLPVPVYVQR